MELATQEADAAFAHFRVVAVRKADNIVVDSCGAAGIFNVAVGSIEFGVANVLTNSLIKEAGVLRNDTKGIVKTSLSD